ncbi:Uncharacterised protein r2_g4140 [Pycnogonum litorale]
MSFNDHESGSSCTQSDQLRVQDTGHDDGQDNSAFLSADPFGGGGKTKLRSSLKKESSPAASSNEQKKQKSVSFHSANSSPNERKIMQCKSTSSFVYFTRN